MTGIEIVYQEDRICEVTVSGHSNAENKGKDVVCSAISALTMTLTSGLLKYYPEKIWVGKADSTYKIHVNDVESPEIQAILMFFCNGYQEISVKHDNYIEVKIIKNTGGAFHGT